MIPPQRGDRRARSAFIFQGSAPILTLIPTGESARSAGGPFRRERWPDALMASNVLPPDGVAEAAW